MTYKYDMANLIYFKVKIVAILNFRKVKDENIYLCQIWIPKLKNIYNDPTISMS